MLVYSSHLQINMNDLQSLKINLHLESLLQIFEITIWKVNAHITKCPRSEQNWIIVFTYLNGATAPTV